MIAGDRLGHLDQVVLGTERPAIDARVLGGVELRIVRLACGLGRRPAHHLRAGQRGAASEGVGLHGTYTFLEARDVVIERSRSQVVVRGTVDDPRGLRVKRTIRTAVGEGRVEVADRTLNRADGPLEAPLLYHVNLGWPLWDDGARVETDGSEVRPRDEHAAPHDWSSAPARPGSLPERVWEHMGATRAAVVNDRLGLRVIIESDLPRLWQWVDLEAGHLRARARAGELLRARARPTTGRRARSRSSHHARSERRESR